MSVADYIGIATLFSVVLATALGAYWKSRQPRDEEAEEPYRAKPIVVALHDEDRNRIDRAAGRIEEALDHHSKIVSRSLDEHGERIADQTDALTDALKHPKD